MQGLVYDMFSVGGLVSACKVKKLEYLYGNMEDRIV